MRENKICQALLFLALGFLEFITIELFFDRNIIDLGVALILKNVLLYWVINLVLVSLFHRMKPAMLISTILVLVLGIANYLVQMFRGYGIVFMDFYAIRTVATVMGHYSVEVHPCMIAGIATGILSIVACFLFPVKSGRYLQKKSILVSFAGLALSALFFVWINTSSTFFRDVSELTWDHQIGIHDYGYALYFAANTGSAKISVPQGYSPKRAEEILSRYADAENGGYGKTEDAETEGEGNLENQDAGPNLIMIMNESFADLRVLGEDFHSSHNAMPFYDSLTENTIKGYAEASVYGGYTANSEFEFLTGCTKAFLPGNPYLQYMTEELPSLITTVKAQDGYEDAIAMHPYNPSGYNRNRVYPLFSFDRFISLEDFRQPELLRGYVSDAEDYRQICRQYEEKLPGTKLCLFNVTMQNHNPYTADWTSDDPVKVSDQLGDSSVNQYLSLVKKSDDALRELIWYFSKASEPTLILLFGDHQPHLPDRFYGRVMDKFPIQFEEEDVMKEHLVPFMIWANYDIPEQTVEVSSLNYLSGLLLQTAGLQTTHYQRFLQDMEQYLPSVSASGYYDAQGTLGNVQQPEGDAEKWLEEYEIVQYYYLFDSKNRQEKYFTIP